eukprot:98580-Pyramimonas_sp.AAC.1
MSKVAVVLECATDWAQEGGARSCAGSNGYDDGNDEDDDTDDGGDDGGCDGADDETDDADYDDGAGPSSTKYPEAPSPLKQSTDVRLPLRHCPRARFVKCENALRAKSFQ